MERASSQNWFWLRAAVSSPASVGQSEGICRVAAEKMYARTLDLSIVKTVQNQLFLAGQVESDKGVQDDCYLGIPQTVMACGEPYLEL